MNLKILGDYILFETPKILAEFQFLATPKEFILLVVSAVYHLPLALI